MKELSIKDKAKRYDEILAKAKVEYAKFEGMLPGDVLEDVIPELKESEDEKIKKEILEYFQQFKNEGLRGINISDWIAWLEKQGEQKSANKVEPKFHEGDWVVISTIKGDTIVQIASVEYFKDGNPYYITTEGRRFGNGTKAHLLPDKVEPKFKVGDWIVTKANNLYQVMAIIDDNYQLNYGDNYIIQKCVDVDKNAKLLNDKDVETITIQKSKIIVNQKPTEWSEEDSIRLQRIIDFLWYNRKGDTDTIYQQEQDIDWLKSLRPHTHWKPTEEQIEYLAAVVEESNENPILDSLYHDLKELIKQ